MWEWVGMSTVCIFASIAAINWHLVRARDVFAYRLPLIRPSACVFLFRDGKLTSATGSAKTLLANDQSETNWSDLRNLLVERFPSFPISTEGLAPSGTTVLTSVTREDRGRILIEPVGDTVQVEIVSDDPEGSTISSLVPDKSEDLRRMREIARCTPNPIWIVDGNGEEIWHNDAYAQLKRSIKKSGRDEHKPLFSNASNANGKTSRHSIELSDRSDPGWFDISSVRTGRERVFYAVDASAVVTAETNQRNFIQTLAKTFAQLSTGLAIFDRQLRLVLFNPALIDLTRLDAEFLSARPNLLSFFDRLRDGQVMPEPKDYASWRDAMAAMVAAANDGSYCETWTLPSGATYQVSGRPHPDGAVAFLFSDISAEVSLTRRFRSDLELYQCILDELEDAVAVFSPSGVLTMTNTVYQTLWNVGCDGSLAEVTIIDAMRDWQKIAGPSPFWGELRDYVLGGKDRVAWSDTLTGQDKRKIECYVHPIHGGSTMLQMKIVENVAQGNTSSLVMLAE